MYQMVRERLLAEKEKLGISPKTMAERSRLRFPENTIKRVLSGETSDPGVSTLVDIGETLGLQPYEIFMDEITAAEFRAYQEIKNVADEAKADCIRLKAVTDELRERNVALSDKITMLEMMVAHRDDMIQVYKDCVELLKMSIKVEQ